MNHTRREFVATAGAAVASLAMPSLVSAEDTDAGKKKHLVTLSFDDGFRKSFARTAEIYEKHGLKACLNVIATGHEASYAAPGTYIGGSPRGDFVLWNELKERGHEVMPHGYRHANLRQLPFDQAKDLIVRCLDIFERKLKGFDPKQAVFNFPYNASTAELEQWLPSQVKAFRTGGGAVNSLPHAGQVKLTCTSFGPGNCEQAIDREIQRLLARESGWLIFNTHGLDNEGWGPIRSVYLEKLLERLATIESVAVLPAGGALATHAGSG
jgi:peptidoglycan/xylan/chitin deacetylase (PgdA/CDA1 family)